MQVLHEFSRLRQTYPELGLAYKSTLSPRAKILRKQQPTSLTTTSIQRFGFTTKTVLIIQTHDEQPLLRRTSTPPFVEISLPQYVFVTPWPSSEMFLPTDREIRLRPRMTRQKTKTQSSRMHNRLQRHQPLQMSSMRTLHMPRACPVWTLSAAI